MNNLWKKNCPECGVEQVYSSKYILCNAITENKRCNKCRWNEYRIKVPPEGWTKKCRRCGKEQSYSCKSALASAIKINSSCPSCRGLKSRTRPTSEKWKRKCSSCQKEIVYKSAKSYLFCVRHNTKCRTCATKESSKCVDKSVFQTWKYKRKMSEILKIKRKTESYGESFKQKCRMNKLKQIQRQGVCQTYNPDACVFMDTVSKNFGWNLQHAMNGGEVSVVGYLLDGYDSNRNIVFEYDEPKHKTPFHLKKDKIRQNRIIDALHPSAFFRYDERDEKLVEVIGNKEVICQPQ